MRIGGLATGMDIDELVNKLMSAERLPLDRMQQERTMLTWKRDAFRDINLAVKQVKDSIYNMKLSTTYLPKSVSSTNDNAVTAKATTKAVDGAYKIKVSQLATAAMNIGTVNTGENLSDYQGTYEFYTYDENGNEETHEFTIKADDTLETVLKRISDDDNNVRMFYDEQSKQVILEATRTGKYNVNEERNGNEIEWGTNNTFFSNFLNLSLTEQKDASGNIVAIGEKGGTNAQFTYNDHLTLTSKDNTYTLNGIIFEFHDTTNDSQAILSVKNDVDASYEAIKEFVDKYNELVDKLNKTQLEERHRDYPPLTNEQKEEMSEDQIKMWEEKAKSGILRGESIISDSLFDMRRSWYAKVETGGEYTALSQVGITTTKSYLDGGKLEINEEKLKTALREDPESVYQLFSNNVEGSSRGLINRLEDSLGTTMGKIEERAGKSYSTLEGYTIGKNMKDLNERISNFERKLVNLESRYWRQFTAMEKAIQRMNQQSTYLMSQFNGG